MRFQTGELNKYQSDTFMKNVKSYLYSKKGFRENKLNPGLKIVRAQFYTFNFKIVE